MCYLSSDKKAPPRIWLAQGSLCARKNGLLVYFFLSWSSLQKSLLHIVFSVSKDSWSICLSSSADGLKRQKKRTREENTHTHAHSLSLTHTHIFSLKHTHKHIQYVAKVAVCRCWKAYWTDAETLSTQSQTINKAWLCPWQLTDWLCFSGTERERGGERRLYHQFNSRQPAWLYHTIRRWNLHCV